MSCNEIAWLRFEILNAIDRDDRLIIVFNRRSWQKNEKKEKKRSKNKKLTLHVISFVLLLTEFRYILSTSLVY